MKTELKFLKIDDLYALNKQERLIVDRKYQRASNWDKSTQQLFIDSILREYPVPLIYIHKQNDKYYIIDGQQRVNAIIAFLKNKIKLLSPEKNPKLFPQYLAKETCEWSDKKFNELSNNKQESFKNKLLSVAYIEDADDKEVRNLFVRLQKGKPLTAQQVRDTSISGINDFILKIGGKNDLQSNVEFVLSLVGTDGTPNGHDFFNESLKITKTDRGQTRQLAAQLLMLYMEMIYNNKIVTINSSNIDDFYLKNLDFDAESEEAKDFESILDVLYNTIDSKVRLDNYEAIHLLLFTKKLKDLGIKNYAEKLNEAFLQFRNTLSEARKNETGEYWTEFGIGTGTNAAKDKTIEKRHSFFVDKMIDFMFGGYNLASADLDNDFNVNIIVASEADKELIKAILILIPIKENPYLPEIVEDYFKYWNKKSKKGKGELNEKKTSKLSESISKEQLIGFINNCIKRDNRFIEIYAQRTIFRTRHLVDINRLNLLPKSPHLVERNTEQLINGWWIHTSSNNHTEKPKYYKIAEEVIEELRNQN